MSRRIRAVAFLVPFAFLLLGGAAAQAPEAEAAEGYQAFVACGEASEPKPSHVCERGDVIGAFFESTIGDVTYEVCIFFPGNTELCAPDQVATANTLYANRITTSALGVHSVVWKVGGVTVGEWSFRLVKPVRPPTVTRREAERAARSLLRDIASWRKRSVGYYDCFGGKINRITWSCDVGWIKGRRCFRGKVRVTGAVKNRKQGFRTQINYRRVC